MNFKEFFTFIWEELIKEPVLVLLAKDPCKKCIVRACCTNQCEKRVQYLKHCDNPYGHIRWRQFSSITILYGIISLFVSLIMVIKNHCF